VLLHASAGEYNDLATAFMSNQDETIKHIFSLGRLSRTYQVCKDDNCYFTLRTLFILTATYWFFMVLLGGIVIPGGLFMPSIMVRRLSLQARSHILGLYISVAAVTG
jgi:chloride channel 7